jgi:cell division protein FtsB
MLADTNEKPGVGELYSTAVNGASLRVGNDPAVRTPGDLIAAAGMNAHRTGLALTRLVTEWESGATPPQANPPSVKEIKRSLGVDTSVAEAERRRLVARCTEWAHQENMLRFQRLKALPEIRSGLLFFVRERGWEDGEHMVAAVLRRFLSPVCPVCAGRTKDVVAGTGRLGKRECGECRGTGLVKVPYGRRGEVLLAHMLACIGQSAHDLQQGARSLHRSSANIESREKHRGELSQAQRRRVDAEAKEDLLDDAEAVAEKFRNAFGAKRLRY